MSSRAAIKVISFDLYETLVTTDFALAVWYEGIPYVYSSKRGISLDSAKAEVISAYRTVSKDSLEYYDLKYWSRRLDLGGYEAAIDYCKHKVAYYPEVVPVLSELSEKYPLVISTGMPAEFMPPIMAGIERYFRRIFSCYSDFSEFKSPSFYLTVCKEMRIAPSGMLHVGDNWKKDYIMAGEAGVRALHLDRGSQPGFCTITDLTQLEGRINSISNNRIVIARALARSNP